MKRIKAIFNSIRTLGGAPDVNITQALNRIRTDIMKHDDAASNAADWHLIEQVVFGVIEEAAAHMKKQDKEAAKAAG